MEKVFLALILDGNDELLELPGVRSIYYMIAGDHIRLRLYPTRHVIFLFFINIIFIVILMFFISPSG